MNGAVPARMASGTSIVSSRAPSGVESGSCRLPIRATPSNSATTRVLVILIPKLQGAVNRISLFMAAIFSPGGPLRPARRVLTSVLSRARRRHLEQQVGPATRAAPRHPPLRIAPIPFLHPRLLDLKLLQLQQERIALRLLRRLVDLA